MTGPSEINSGGKLGSPTGSTELECIHMLDRVLQKPYQGLRGNRTAAY